MYCTRKVTEDLVWVGADDRRLMMFEGIYPVPQGVSYNSYLLLDEKTVLFDTVDEAVEKQFLENVEAALHGRKLDYLVVQHMEPDHSANIHNFISQYPDAKIVASQKAFDIMKNFFGTDYEDNRIIVKGKRREIWQF